MHYSYFDNGITEATTMISTTAIEKVKAMPNGLIPLEIARIIITVVSHIF
jgi:hypothetical protein